MEKSSFTLIGRYQYSSEAFIYKGKLESSGFEVFIRDNNTIDSNPLYSNAIGGIKLYVKNVDVAKADEVLSEISAYSLDDNNQLLQCSKCGGKQIEMVTSITSLKTFLTFLFSVLIVLMPFYSKFKYKCNECKFEFN